MHSILLVLAMAMATEVKIDILTPKTSVLPGEPLKVVLRWYAPPGTDVKLENDNEGLRRFLQVWVDDGAGFRRYCEAPRAPVEGVALEALPKTPRPYIQNIALVGGEYSAACNGTSRKSFVFPTPGHYRLRVTYAPSRNVSAVSSNVLTFEVSPPEAEDAALFSEIQKAPWLLLTGGDGDKGTLLTQHPDSPYLSYAKVLAFWEWEARLSNHENPDTGQQLWHLAPDEYEHWLKDQWRRKSHELMVERGWGAFDEERLSHALSAAERGDDVAAAVRIRAEAANRFDGSQLMQRIRKETTEKAKDRDESDEPLVKRPSPTPR